MKNQNKKDQNEAYEIIDVTDIDGEIDLEMTYGIHIDTRKYEDVVKREKQFRLDGIAKVEGSIFVNFKFSSIEVKQLKDPKKIAFINCKIKNLQINDSYAQDMEFINCEIKDSKFINSDLPGIRFSSEMSDDLKVIIKDALKKNPKNEKKINVALKPSISTPLIDNSKFLFCSLNEMYIDNMTFSNIEIKHCELEDTEISQNVEMKNIDLRGAKVFDVDFGKCKFSNIRFNKPRYLFEFISSILRGLLKLGFYLYFPGYGGIKKRYFKTKNQKFQLKKQFRKKVLKCRYVIKKMLYFKPLKTTIDVLSSTDLKRIKNKYADFNEARFFSWYIHDLESIDRLNKRHPLGGAFLFLSSNYMRSFGVLACWVVFFIGIFSWAFSNFGRFTLDQEYIRKNVPQLIHKENRNQNKPLVTLTFSSPNALFPVQTNLTINYHIPKMNPNNFTHPDDRVKDPLLLSFKVFMKLIIYPLQPKNKVTKWLIVAERIMGFIALGVLISLLTAPFSRKSFFSRE